MPVISVVGDSVLGSCTHVQTYFPNPTLNFVVSGSITEGSDVVFVGPLAKPATKASPATKFSHSHCEGTGSTNQFSVDAPAVLSKVFMGEAADAPAYVGSTTTHCGGVGVITGPGWPGVG